LIRHRVIKHIKTAVKNSQKPRSLWRRVTSRHFGCYLLFRPSVHPSVCLSRAVL